MHGQIDVTTFDNPTVNVTIKNQFHLQDTISIYFV